MLQFQETNVTKDEAEYILKYRDLTIEIQGMWNVTINVTPIIIRATATISKSFGKYQKDLTLQIVLYAL